MQKYSSIDEMRLATKDLSAAQLVDALYARMDDPNAFGDEFAADGVNGIVSTRLQFSLRVIVQLLMSCVRADAQKRREDVGAAIENACGSVSGAIDEARENKGHINW